MDRRTCSYPRAYVLLLSSLAAMWETQVEIRLSSFFLTVFAVTRPCEFQNGVLGCASLCLPLSSRGDNTDKRVSVPWRANLANTGMLHNGIFFSEVHLLKNTGVQT
jgi:hypothetical protein